MELIVIAFNFDSEFQFAGLTVRWQTVALVVSIVVMLAVAATAAVRQLAVPRHAVADGPPDGRSPELDHPLGTDLLMVAIGTIPGAIVAGRLGYILAHFDYYASQPGLWLNVDYGSLELGSAVIGATLTGALVARGLIWPISRWLHVAAGPLLLGLVLGKLAMALGGEGQGQFSDASWATTYVGSGPWGSLAAGFPAHPAQIYEALLTLVALVALLALQDLGRFSDEDGRAFAVALFLWSVARTVAGFWWRDPTVIGPFRPTQLISLAIAGVALAAWLRLARRREPSPAA